MTKTKYVERVVIVLNPDGSLKGAHQSGLETIHKDGKLVSERETPAMPVDQMTLAQVLPEAAALTAQASALAAERDALRAELESAGAGPASSAAGLPKLALIDRLSEAGLFDAALAALKADPLKYALAGRKHRRPG